MHFGIQLDNGADFDLEYNTETQKYELLITTDRTSMASIKIEMDKEAFANICHELTK